MTHTKWYNPRRNKHDIIIASITASAQIFCFIIYLLLPSEMSDAKKKKSTVYVPYFLWVIGKLFADSSAACVCVFPEVRVKKVWASVSETREWRRWRGNHLRRSRERWGRRRWKSEVLITSFKAPPKGKSIPEDTHNHTLAISRSKHLVSGEFLRRHSEVHLTFSFFFFYSASQFFKMFLLFLKQLPGSQGTWWK